MGVAEKRNGHVQSGDVACVVSCQIKRFFRKVPIICISRSSPALELVPAMDELVCRIFLKSLACIRRKLSGVARSHSLLAESILSSLPVALPSEVFINAAEEFAVEDLRFN